MLESWKQATEGTDANDSPDVLYYIPKFDGPLLAEQLGPVVGALGVNLYKATIQVYRCGTAEGPRDVEYRRQMLRNLRNESADDERGDLDIHPELLFCEYEDFKIKGLRTLDGVALDNFRGLLVEKRDIIPFNFDCLLDEPDRKKYAIKRGVSVSCGVSYKHQITHSFLFLTGSGIPRTL